MNPLHTLQWWVSSGVNAGHPLEKLLCLAYEPELTGLPDLPGLIRQEYNKCREELLKHNAERAARKAQEDARRAEQARIAALNPAPLPPTPPEPPPPKKPRCALRSITRQGRAGRKVKYIPKALERRPIPGYPGCEIDSNHHVFKADGNEATYSFNKRFRTCARIKSESGQWKEPSILDLLEKVDFRRYVRKYREPKNPYAPYTDLAEAHAEEPELFPDPTCRSSCCPENAD